MMEKNYLLLLLIQWEMTKKVLAIKETINTYLNQYIGESINDNYF